MIIFDYCLKLSEVLSPFLTYMSQKGWTMARVPISPILKRDPRKRGKKRDKLV